MWHAEHPVSARQVNYFPSRFDPVRHAEKYPIPSAPISGRREKAIIVKENNFQQPGARFRAWDPARQDRFISRLAGMLADPRVTQVRRFGGHAALTMIFSIDLATGGC